MNLSQLRYFVAVAELENLSLAASRLRIAQSAVSRQIRLLEEELGVLLLERVGRGVLLTEAGRTLLERSRHLFEEIESIRSEVVDRSVVPSGTLRIGVNPSLGHTLFPLVAARCRADYPNIKLHLVADLTSPVQEWLRRGELDFAIVSFPERDQEVVSTPLTREQIFLISAAANAPELGAECTIRSIEDLPLILPGLPNRERLGYERLAATQGYKLTCHIECDSLPVMKSLAQAGLGHLLLPYIAIAEDRSQPSWKVARIREIAVERHIVRSVRRPVTTAMAVVTGIIKDEVEKLRQSGAIR